MSDWLGLLEDDNERRAIMYVSADSEGSARERIGYMLSSSEARVVDVLTVELLTYEISTATSWLRGGA